MKIYRDKMQEPGVIRKHTAKQMKKDLKNVFDSRSQVKYELTRRFGVAAAAGDRHLAEFVPWFLTDRDSCYRWGFCLTPYSYRVERWKYASKTFRRQISGKEAITLDQSGEEYINQMAALCGLTEFRTNVNLPNRGQMGKTAEGAVVETNAIFSRDRVEPIQSGSLPDAVNSLVQTHVMNQENAVKAALEGDKDLGFQAFASDPLCHRLSMDDAWKMYNQMLRATKFEF